MIVAGPDGLMKNAYRKFTIRGPKLVTPQPPTLDALSRNAGEGLSAAIASPASRTAGEGEGAAGDG